MRFSNLCIGLLAVLTPLASAWSKEDREIFRVRDELASHEGSNVTFYDYLGTVPSASQDDINKAYRKKTKFLHPDKVKQKIQSEAKKAKKEDPNTKVKPPTASEIKAAVKKASDEQARLSIVANILRGSGRERYDYFLSNGFPTWKGTEYYYNRYRPGLGTVLIGVFIVAGGGIHYLILYLSWKRQREFGQRYIKFARTAAWGENMGIPGIDATARAPTPQQQMVEDDEGNVMPNNRKMRRFQQRDNRKENDGPVRGKRQTRSRRVAPAGADAEAREQSGPQGAKKRVVAENGKVLVVDSVGDVYLEHVDENGNVDELLLDPEELHCPTVNDTALMRVPAYFWNQSFGRLMPKGAAASAAEDNNESGESREETPAADSASKKAGSDSPGSVGDDYEILEKSVDDLGRAKTTGAQGGGKANKRKGKGKKN